jgi:hypothetical protein
MPLPYSADLRERVLLAHEHDEGNAAVTEPVRSEMATDPISRPLSPLLRRLVGPSMGS